MKKMRKLDLADLTKLYAILVFHCGAPQADLEQFIRYVLTWDPTRSLEWRFQGSLGFGGKIWLYNSEAPYVNFYPEDSTPLRERAVLKANDELAELFKGGRAR